MYATFTEYKEKFLLGREAIIPEASFNFYSTNASREVDKFTMNRLKNKEVLEEYKESVFRATCGVAELFWTNENETEVASQSHGGFSQSFVKDEKTNEDKIRIIINRELALTGLLFRGI